MFKRAPKRSFKLASQDTTKVNKKLPLEERIKFVSLSSVDHRKGKKRQLTLIILLIAIIAAIYYVGSPSSKVQDLNIDENDVEMVQ